MGFIPNFTIAQKLPFVVVGSALLVSAGVGLASYLISATVMETMTQQRLQAISVERAEKIEILLDGLAADVTQLATTALTQDTARAMQVNWTQIDNAAAQVRDIYITKNPYAAGERDQLNIGETRTVYDFSHTNFHPGLRSVAHERGYEDLFVFDPAGNLLYTVNKNDDFATNFAIEGGGPYAESALGTVFRQAVTFAAPGSVAFADDLAYAPGGGGLASFVATGIFGKSGEQLGVLAVQLPLGRIDEAMRSRNGLGESGEKPPPVFTVPE